MLNINISTLERNSFFDSSIIRVPVTRHDEKTMRVEGFHRVYTLLYSFYFRLVTRITLLLVRSISFLLCPNIRIRLIRAGSWIFGKIKIIRERFGLLRTRENLLWSLRRWKNAKVGTRSVIYRELHVQGRRRCVRSISAILFNVAIKWRKRSTNCYRSVYIQIILDSI